MKRNMKTIELLSKISGLDQAEVAVSFEKVKENIKRLKACPKHLFLEKKAFDSICSNCGGKMDGIGVLHYAEGYKAAGGDPLDVWPAMNQKGKM